MHLPPSPAWHGPGATGTSRVILGVDFGVGMELEALASLPMYRQPHGQKS